MINKQKKVPFSVSLVIPLFNNSMTLYKQLKTCIKVLNIVCDKFEILISDDASSDNSFEILKKEFAKKKFIKIFHKKTNLGISKNIRFLYDKSSSDYILLFSVDGAWDPNDIERLIKAAYNSNADMVIGKRRKKKYSLLRILVSFFYNFLPFLLFGTKTFDVGSIKIFKRSLYKNFKLTSKSIFFESELLIKAQKNKFKIIQIPINHFSSGSHKSGVNISLIINSTIDLIRLRVSG